MLLLRETDGPIPEAPSHIFSILISDELAKISDAARRKGPIDWTWLHILSKQAALQQIKFDDRFLKQIAQSILRYLMETIGSTPKPERAADIIRFLDLCQEIGVEPDLWECRNTYYDLHHDQLFRNALDPESAEAFSKLGQRFGFIS